MVRNQERLAHVQALRTHARETVAEFGDRLRGICQYVNEKYDVEGLCRKLPGRLQKIVDAGGDRIKD